MVFIISVTAMLTVKTTSSRYILSFHPSVDRVIPHVIPPSYPPCMHVNDDVSEVLGRYTATVAMWPPAWFLLDEKNVGLINSKALTELSQLCAL